MLKITPTLLEGYRYYMKDIKSRQEFLDSLAKIKMKPTDAMLKGIEFENYIRKCCEAKSGQWMEISSIFDCRIVSEIAAIIENGIWQVTCKKELQVEDENYLLYGRCDVIKEDTIYDIKFTQSYEIGKYYPSIQHLIYMYCTEISKFTYLASDGKDWWSEDYYAESDLEDRIKERVFEFRNYLKHDKEAEELYLDNWRAK